MDGFLGFWYVFFRFLFPLMGLMGLIGFHIYIIGNVCVCTCTLYICVSLMRRDSCTAHGFFGGQLMACRVDNLRFFGWLTYGRVNGLLTAVPSEQLAATLSG